MPAANVNRLRVYVYVNDMTPPRQLLDGPRFQLVAAAASLSLDLLECHQGLASLRNTATALLNSTKTNLEAIGRDPSQSNQYAQEFIDRLKAELPCIMINDTHAANALTDKIRTRMAFPEDDATFQPRCAAAVQLNSRLLLHAEKARAKQEAEGTDESRRAVYSIVFRMGVTLAHEMCHIFTAFLLRNPRAPTPPGIAVAPFGDKRRGEIGRFWESLILGGYADMVLKQDGFSVAVRCLGGNVVYIIKDMAIEFFLQRNFDSLPLVDEGEIDRDLVQRVRAFDWLQNGGDPYLGATVGHIATLSPHLLDAFTLPEMTSDYGESVFVSGPAVMQWLTMAGAAAPVAA